MGFYTRRYPLFLFTDVFAHSFGIGKAQRTYGEILNPQFRWGKLNQLM